MNTDNPIDLLFGGMEKLGPGGPVHTRYVLRLLPKQQFRIIVDAGCGTGSQTLVLAKELGTLVHAVDSYEPFLNDLTRRCDAQKLDHPGFPADQLTDRRGFLNTDDCKFTLDTRALRHDNGRR